jgi:hypothetical protein
LGNGDLSKAGKVTAGDIEQSILSGSIETTGSHSSYVPKTLQK